MMVLVLAALLFLHQPDARAEEDGQPPAFEWNVFLDDWHILGPFPRTHESHGLDVDFLGYLGDDGNPEMRVIGEADLEYTGLTIVPENLAPKPTTPELITEVAAEFVDLGCYGLPRHDRFRFLFPPST